MSAALFKFKDSDLESRLIAGRIFIAGIMVFVIMLTIIWRVFHLQIVLHDHYSTLSQSNRVKIVPIAPTRGLIFSSDGVLLADNRSSFSLEVIPEQAGDMDQGISEIAEIIELDDPAIQRFRSGLKKKRRFESIPLIYNLSDEEVARISVNLHRLAGVDVVARLNRYYPLSSNTSHAIGYVGMIDELELETLDTSNYSATSHIGKTGVEKAYENLLHGQVGYQQVEVNSLGRVVRVLDRTSPVPGQNIYLTLDVSLQNLAMQAMDGRRGAIVAIDPASGGVLALVSSPGFDPNPFVYGIDWKTYRSLLDSPDTPLLNRALRGRYPPGSTIKPMLGLTALHYNVRTEENKTWCPGWYVLKGTGLRKRDWKREGHGHTDLVKAIAESCDVYFYALSNDMGIDRVHESFSGFGFGQRTRIDIGGESIGLLPSREWKQKTFNEPWYPGETLNLGIGQGALLVTPLQLAVATAALANRGRVLEPHLFAEARDPVSGEITAHGSPSELYTLAYTDVHWDTIIAAMEEVVHGRHGTARRAGLGTEYRFAGKSGTAQVFSLGRDEEYKEEELVKELHDHALFIAFAPLERPRIAVAVIVENAGGGSANAAPIARLLFDYYLNQDNYRITADRL